MKSIINNNIHKLFIISTLFFGFLMLMIVPPFQVPDEATHFYKSYLMSKGDILPESVNGVQGYYLSKDIYDQVQKYTQQIAGNRDEKYSYSELILNDRLPIDYGNVQFITFSTVGSNPVAHMIPTIGIICGKVLAKITQGGHASVTYLLYFARFANLMMYTILIGFAIKNTPILKKTMLLLAIMPMSLFLGASMSYDSLIIASTFFVVSIFFRLIFDDEYDITNQKLIILAIFAAIIGVIKPNYILTYLLLFFVPIDKFKNRKEYFKTAGIFCLMVLFVYLVLKIPYLFIQNIEDPSIVSQSGTNYLAQQITYLKTNPFVFFSAVYNTLANNINYYISTTVATFGLIDTYVPNFVSYLYLVLIIIVGIVEMSNCKYKVSILMKLSSIGIFIVGILSIFLALYLSWTSMEIGIGSNIVTGVQGRYFIPFLILPFICFQSRFLQKNKIANFAMETYDSYYLFLVYSIIFVCLIFMLIRFWC